MNVTLRPRDPVGLGNDYLQRGLCLGHTRLVNKFVQRWQVGQILKEPIFNQRNANFEDMKDMWRYAKTCRIQDCG